MRLRGQGMTEPGAKFPGTLPTFGALVDQRTPIPMRWLNLTAALCAVTVATTQTINTAGTPASSRNQDTNQLIKSTMPAAVEPPFRLPAPGRKNDSSTA